ncbi:hypothetical protein TIFTF001_030895 [Ficus carica]|uniref:DUF7815 domain-containing protein n=1 Tax=Ficus carica TaxID=3494 RepID=A0AA88DVM8_FICCA|nr:hypothetical protein TIFTF001_030895 [Ficus carica]
MEVPIDLIQQVQISLRKHANLSNDPSLPILPSPEEAVAALDPSPPYLRCRNCKGRLLRGIQSLICVFCGREAFNDVVPDPLNFRNTLGYRWLLESLNLDGSETVAPPDEANNSHRGRAVPKDEFPLSDLLDLQIKWPSEIDAREITQGHANLNLFGSAKLSGTGNENLSLFENVKPSQTGNENFSLFDNAQFSETSLPSIEGDSKNNHDSGWGADFQSAASTTLHKDSTSFDPLVGSTDLSAHMDEVFGLAKDSINKINEEPIGSTSTAGDWFVDNTWKNSNPGFIGPTEDSKVPANVKNESIVENVNYSSPADDGWVHDNRWQSNSKNGPDNKGDEDNDSLDDCNNFASLSIAQAPSNSTSKQTTRASDDKTSETNLFSSVDHPHDINLLDSFSQPDLFSGGFGSSNASAEGNKMLPEASVLDRTAEANTKLGGNSEEVAKAGDVYTAETTSKNVEALLSRMHDLSFMLESNLSIPSTQEGSNSKSKD